MKPKVDVHAAQSYSFSPEEAYFFDANIWLYIYGPQGNPQDLLPRIYSGVLAGALKAHSKTYIDCLILSEFVNRYARLEHKPLVRTGAADPDFKIFRDSPTFKTVATQIASAIRRIFKDSIPLESGFTTLDPEQLVLAYESGGMDINDLILAELCRSEKLKFVTHDSDFANLDVPILTANPRLLAK